MTAANPNHDLAVLRVNATLQPVTLRNTPARTGEEVVAIGSPIGLTNTVSTGIVSALRKMQGREVIQISAPISHGSSGGGLFDRQGNLIGITFAGMEEGQNLNFAIPVSQVQQVVAKAGSPQALPGVTRVTPENLVTVLKQSHPALVINGARVELDYVLLPYSKARPGEAPDVLYVVMENEQYYNFARGMVTGDVPKNMAMVEAFLKEIALVVDKAYPGLEVAAVLLHVGEYQTYPTMFRPDEIQYDAPTRLWVVFHPELLVTEWNGEWIVE